MVNRDRDRNNTRVTRPEVDFNLKLSSLNFRISYVNHYRYVFSVRLLDPLTIALQVKHVAAILITPLKYYHNLNIQNNLIVIVGVFILVYYFLLLNEN